MASSMIHYIISNQVILQYPVQNKSSFLLGAALGPDASSHDDGTYNAAHFSNTKGGKKGIDWRLFEKKYGGRMFSDEFYLGYWCHLVQDSVWFHNITDKYIRIYTGEVKKEYLQKGYRDYGRLNYLLQQEYKPPIPEFTPDIPTMEEISKDRLILLSKDFHNHFNALPCERESLELYKWNVIVNFIEYSASLCISEIRALQQGKRRVEPETLFVKK